MHEAACKNLLEKAELLIENGAEINSDSSEHDYRVTPLHLSACEGHIKMSKLLIESGANANALDSKGYSPLLVAVYFNQIESIEYLLENGADINAHFIDGWTIGVLAENYFSTSDGETFGDECLCHKELKTGFRILIA